MIRPQLLLTDLQRPQAERFRLCVSPLFKVQSSEIAKHVSYLRVIRSKRLFADLQRSQAKRFRFRVSPLLKVQHGQV